MKKRCIYLLFTALLFVNYTYAQQSRIAQLKIKLESIALEAPGLTEKVDLNVKNTALPGFLQAVAHANEINVNIDPSLQDLFITNNFANATVLDVFLFVCKTYTLDIELTGNILSFTKFKAPLEVTPHREIPIQYDATNDLLSVDLKSDTLYIAVKQIATKTNKNLVFAPGLENMTISSFIQSTSFDSAMDKIAFANNLTIQKTRDNFYLIEKEEEFVVAMQKEGVKSTPKPRPKRKRRSNFFFHVNDTLAKTLNVDFENTPISSIIYDIGLDLKLNMFTASPLDKAGTASVKANNITFDLLLNKILENTPFTFKKEKNIYYFGEKSQITLRKSVYIPLQHRSIEIMTTGSNTNRNRMSSSQYSNTNYYNNNFNNNQNTQRNNRPNSGSTQNPNKGNQTLVEDLLRIFPDDVIKDLDIKTDIELNSFIVSGPSQQIERFKDFVIYIDKPVPVVLIEVMVLEVKKSATVETGINMGIGESPTPTQGEIFPNIDISIGANTINKVIGGFSGFGSFNLGQVVPNFYLQLKAMETNGNIKIRSSPKLSTLNGHRANLSIGETSYYAVTERNIYGSQNPQTSEITNYHPIDAEFALNIKPLVSGDGHITLDINVSQSTFNGIKIAEDAPPGMNSREFNSIIRVKNQDLVILGGLEDQIKNDSGKGVPFLSRVPIIKWLFSSRSRNDSKNKLTVLIKPTVIN